MSKKMQKYLLAEREGFPSLLFAFAHWFSPLSYSLRYNFATAKSPGGERGIRSVYGSLRSLGSSSLSIAYAMTLLSQSSPGGERGIRTLGTVLPVHSLSRRAPSASRSSLQVGILLSMNTEGKDY